LVEIETIQRGRSMDRMLAALTLAVILLGGVVVWETFSIKQTGYIKVATHVDYEPRGEITKNGEVIFQGFPSSIN
jgi:hypothetical protein